MSITKKNKLYFKEGSSSATIRNLNKANPNVYYFLLDYFLNQGGGDKHKKLNAKAKGWQSVKPIDIALPVELEKDFASLTKGPSLLVYYNSTFFQLAKLNLKVKIKKPTAKKPTAKKIK